MKLNTAREKIHTHEGATAKHINAYLQLRRSVMACLLWEGQFYEDGQEIADRIKNLVKLNDPEKVAALAIEARSDFRLRHVPLLLVRELARGNGKLVGDTLAKVIQRADELAEFLVMYWADGKQPLSKQVKRGLAKAFNKFDAYQLAKYNRDGQVKLRDALFLCHAKPVDEAQAAVWKKLVDGTLEAPDTWEVALSGGVDKKAAFERLLTENKLGYMALLRNLRNMRESGVDEKLVFDRLIGNAKQSKALPFRYIAAARAVPEWEPMIDKAMQIAMGDMPRLKGKTLLMLDHSGSMDDSLSSKSDLKRYDAAAGLAILIAGVAERFEVVSFASDPASHGYHYSGRGWQLTASVPPRQGMAMRDAYFNSMREWGGTQLGAALNAVDDGNYDRLVVITDEQSHDRVPDPKGNGYMINIASYKNGVGYGPWTHIDGFSESVIRYIQEVE